MAEPQPVAAGGVDTQRTREIQDKLDQTTQAVQQNIDMATQRGEHLDNLQEQTANIAEGAEQFQKKSHKLEKKLWWKNMKMTMIITVVVIVLLLIISFAIYKAIA